PDRHAAVLEKVVRGARRRAQCLHAEAACLPIGRMVEDRLTAGICAYGRVTTDLDLDVLVGPGWGEPFPPGEVVGSRGLPRAHDRVLDDRLLARVSGGRPGTRDHLGWGMVRPEVPLVVHVEQGG